MKTVGLWRPGSILYAETLYFADQEEDLALELASNFSNDVCLHRLPSKSEDLLPLVSVYLSRINSCKISTSLGDTVWEFLQWVQNTAAKLDGHHLNTGELNRPPGYCPHFPIFRDFVARYQNFISKITRRSILSGIESREFDACWWKEETSFIDEICNLKRLLRRLPERGVVVSKLEHSLSSLGDSLSSYQALSISEKHIALSGIAYALANKSIGRKEFDLALMLLHRSLDLCAQAKGIKEGIVVGRSSGLQYAAHLNDTRPVSLSLTVLYLQRSNAVYFSGQSAFYLQRINNIRNNLILTHSGYSIGNSEASDFSPRANAIIRDICDDFTLWSRHRKSITEVFSASLEIFFEVHDVDSLFASLSPEQLLSNYGL